jgi:hypothetical protein
MAAETEHGLRDFAAEASCLPDLIPPIAIREATGPAGHGAGREGPISAERGPQTGRAITLLMETAISSAPFAVIGRILR